MGMITLVSYADHRMTRSRQNLSVSFRRTHPGGPILERDSGYLMDELSSDYLRHHDIFTESRGAGYWLWKPFIIYDALLKSVKEGDHLLYCDAGITILSSVQPLIDFGEGILLFHNEWRHIDWCKMDVMNAITPGWANEHRPDQQVQASAILIKRSQRTMQFVRDWLTWSLVPRFITDAPSRVPNLPGFREHRHDQAILTCLAIYHGINRHWCPFDWNKDNRAKYPGDAHLPVIFEHHRRRNHGSGGMIDGSGGIVPQWES